MLTDSLLFLLTLLPSYIYLYPLNDSSVPVSVLHAGVLVPNKPDSCMMSPMLNNTSVGVTPWCTICVVTHWDSVLRKIDARFLLS